MEKDKEWLKECIERAADSHSFRMVQDTSVLALIDQLEEPEQGIGAAHDLLAKITTLSQEDFDLYWNCINDGVAVSELKQEKVVVPQFVADWIEDRKSMADHWFEALDSLAADFHNKETDKVEDRIFNWIMANPDLYVDAYRDGYEVEKFRRVLKIGKMYFVSGGLNEEQEFNIKLTENKANAYVFESEQEAKALQSDTGGKFEEVTE